MIQELTGDILHSKAQAIAHGVAPHDHFESGLALALRERYPVMVKDFRHHCHQSNPKPGTLWVWAGHDTARIVSLLTQEPAPSAHGHGHPGKAKVSSVNHCLRELRKWIEEEKIESIALPRLATGVGGLDWSDVRPLMDQHLGDLDTKVLLYTKYAKDEAAAEGL